jgi:hypothetical protein
MSNKPHLTKLLNQKGYSTRISKHDLVLRDGDVGDCRVSIKTDIDALFVNSLLSYGSAITSLRKNNYSWAYIQSYYCIYYLAKLFLAEQDIFLYYVDTTPFKIKISYGESFCKQKGNSHSIILSLFKKQFEDNNSICSQIEGINNIDWLNRKREEINYRLSPMPDPNPPAPLFQYNNDIRKWLATYESEILYSFSEEHCFIAYTTFLINSVVKKYRLSNRKNTYLTSDVLQHLQRNIADEKGPFPIWNSLKDINI